MSQSVGRDCPNDWGRFRYTSQDHKNRPTGNSQKCCPNEVYCNGDCPNQWYTYTSNQGGGLSGTTPTTPRGQKGDQTHFGPNVTPLRALPPGHERCKLPNNNSLPLGWHWCMSEQRVVTDTGVVVPLVDDPLVGTEAQREALRALRKWEATVILFRRRGAA
jgi:hypothetical protein